MTSKILLVCLFAMSSSLIAQREQNTPNGSLLVNLQGPGSEVVRTVADDLSFATSSTTLNAPYALLFGFNTNPISIFSQTLNVDLAGPIVSIVDGIGLGFNPVILPGNPGILVGGSNTVTFLPGTVPALVGGTSQSVILSPSAPSSIELSGAVDWRVIPNLLNDSFAGDDVVRTFTLQRPLFLYGNNYQTLSVSTNGWVKFGASPTNSDFSEDTADFLSGAIGGTSAGSGPIVAALWDDLDLGNNASQRVTVQEFSGGDVVVRWENADYWPAVPLGTIELVLNNANRNGMRIEYQFASVTPARDQGLVGVSDGGVTGTAVAVEHDMSTGYFPTNPSESIFQHFGVGMVAGTFDLAGQTLFINPATTATNWRL